MPKVTYNNLSDLFAQAQSDIDCEGYRDATGYSEPAYDTKFSVSATGGSKDDKGKPTYHLCPYEVITAISEGFKVSVDSGKYEKNNWRKGVEYSKLYDSTMRHINDWFHNRVEFDKESGTHHLVSGIINLTMLYYSVINETPGLDDRYKRERDHDN